MKSLQKFQHVVEGRGEIRIKNFRAINHHDGQIQNLRRRQFRIGAADVPAVLRDDDIGLRVAEKFDIERDTERTLHGDNLFRTQAERFTLRQNIGGRQNSCSQVAIAEQFDENFQCSTARREENIFAELSRRLRRRRAGVDVENFFVSRRSLSAFVADVGNLRNLSGLNCVGGNILGVRVACV